MTRASDALAGGTPAGIPTGGPSALDVRMFVPSLDFERSKHFYLDLGWTLGWEHDGGLAELELAGQRFLLQDYYAEEWAENFMIQVLVDDAIAWYEHVRAVIDRGRYVTARVKPPQQEDWGVVTYVWDPCGVLIHFTESE